MNGLEFLLKHNNIQQTELAEKIGVSKQLISIWIKGTRPIAKTHLPKLCEILNTSESFLKKNIDEQLLNDVVLSVINQDYQCLLATIFNVQKDIIDNTLIDLIKTTIEKKELENKCAELGYKMCKIENE